MSWQGPFHAPPKKEQQKEQVHTSLQPWAAGTATWATMKSTVGSHMQHNETIETQNKHIHRYCIVPCYNYLENYHATKTRNKKKKKRTVRGDKGRNTQQKGSKIIKTIKAHHNLLAARKRWICHIACHLSYCALINVGELGERRSKECTHTHIKHIHRGNK